MDMKDEYFENCKFGGSYPDYELKIYGANCDDYIEILLTTDEAEGEQTKNAVGFIQTLLENGVRFSLVPGEGGIWWNSEYEKYRAYKNRTESIGDNE